MNQNIRVISCNMDNRNPEEIAREIVENVIQIFDEMIENQVEENMNIQL